MGFTAVDLVIFIIVLSLWFVYQRLQNSGLPPGPIGLPFVGSLPFLATKIHEKLAKLKKRYGSLMTVYLGTSPTLILNDWTAIKEALIKEGHAFSGRPNLFVFRELFKDQDIGFTEGAKWKQLRNFSLTNLRNFGFGKSIVEESIVDEAEKIVNSLKLSEGEPILISKSFCVAFLNITWHIVTGKKFTHDDPRLKRFLDSMNFLMDAMSGGSPLNSYPILRHLPYFNFKKAVACNDDVAQMLRDEIHEHDKTFREEELRDFIDVFLQEIKRKNAANEKSHFDVDHLTGVTRDLFFAGMETTDTTLSWTILYAAKYPHVQHKVHEEIDKAIGNERLPSYSDKVNLPYTMAVLLEVSRIVTIVPLSLPHCTMKSTTILGYEIPKGITVLPNLWAVHHDPELWGDPENFRPERFLDSSGKLKEPEYLIPFSAGPRICLGETIAKMEVFIFFTLIMQRFSISFPKHLKEPNMESIDAITTRPQPFSIVVKSRH